MALSFKDALRLSVSALRSGREGQDLGLPLLHVLGKKSQTGTCAGASHQPKVNISMERERFVRKACLSKPMLGKFFGGIGFFSAITLSNVLNDLSVGRYVDVSVVSASFCKINTAAPLLPLTLVCF